MIKLVLNEEVLVHSPGCFELGRDSSAQTDDTNPVTTKFSRWNHMQLYRRYRKDQESSLGSAGLNLQVQ